MTAALIWFRRDLRLADNAALCHALGAGGPVHAVFVFDTDILDGLEARADRRVEFIRQSVAAMKQGLEQVGGGLHVLHGSARRLIPELAQQLDVVQVHAGRDYEPAARARDAEVAETLARHGRQLCLHKDQVIFETDEILSAAGTPFHVFTAYKRAWLARLANEHLAAYDCTAHYPRLAAAPDSRLPSLADLGFTASNLAELKIVPGEAGAQALWQDFQARIESYGALRDFPAKKGPSYLSVHLRFGTIPVRQLARHAFNVDNEGARIWLSELIWRDFYQMLLWHHPETVEHAFQRRFDGIDWPNPPGHFEAWCSARTGYPLVDAAMRQLNQTGYMHNRLRMITASFLVKDLHVDWRLGERYFAANLIDYDQAANLGGWQWSASVGTDAQPWFRIFNPVTQSEKFDPEGRFIRRYLPELARVPDKYIHAPWRMPEAIQHASGIRLGDDYPRPLVDHAIARAITLERFKACP
jgi:deoxyribodipyrimidine photo-lyase